jgi:pyochelin synthetase
MEQLLVELNKRGVKLQLEADELRVSAPAGALTQELRQSLRSNKDQIVRLLRSSRTHAETAVAAIAADSANRYEPFPLTEIQHAYWVGRDGAREGNVATHLYVELDCASLDVERLNEALCRLIERHDMLRAVVNADGRQQIQAAVPRYRISVTDMSAASPDAVDRAMAATRETLSHQSLAPDRWPLFDIRATRLPGSRLRLHVNLDLLILDAWSIFLFFSEWSTLYRDLDATLPPVGISFRDYVCAEERRRDSESYRRAYAYWMERVKSLPPAPDLPLRTDPAARMAPGFTRREARLDKQRWLRLKATAREHGLTPSGLLLALYSEVLARWSSTPHFSLTVTVSQRLPVHRDIHNLLGDFTSLVIHEVDRRDGRRPFVEFARSLQQQFMTDLEHQDVSGVVVTREWAKAHGRSMQAVMPVVFSSGLVYTGGQEPGDLEQFGRKVYSVSQTSQVWLDHHVMELQGELVFIWDAAEAVFENGVLDAMFGAYCEVIERIADDPSVWSRRDVVRLPPEIELRREEANDTADVVPAGRLHAGFVTEALRHPDAVAVITPERTLTYGSLLNESAASADWLIARGLAPGQPVAVVMRKGWEQIAAVYGVLLAGGAYMPVDADLPVRRQLELLQIGDVRHVLTQPGALREGVSSAGYEVLELQAGAQGSYGPQHARLLERPLDELAYVIFTSGTTGVPKGVMIDHRGAINTIAHVNRLYAVDRHDRVLGVSSLSFDLSVYDIFGLLGVGGALVLPDHRRGHDAVHWRELIQQHEVTLWNSAPQLMRMLIDSFTTADNDIASLRTVLLSGDFIPLDLPDRIRARAPRAQVVSLGGATEASIWSNYHPVEAVDLAASSIPYGKALPNQQIWVLDSALRPCPDHVKGRIYLGGAGLAIGYWKDPEKTAARFITHPETGQRLYDTGDLGRYAADGDVIILGRDDGQIKIRGHRVELGEIEAVLRQHPDVRFAVVVATAGSGDSRRLIAYLEVAAGASTMDAQSVKAYLGERVPDYMVPRDVVLMDRIPVSANGKIDYKALPAVADEETRPERVLPRTDAERKIFEAWSRIFAGVEIGVTDNFFELGGDSILATQLVRELTTTLSLDLEMHELFEHLTIESLAALYESKLSGNAAAAGTASAIADRETLLADVRAAIGRIEPLVFTAHGSVTPPRAILLTGATGWVGAHLLPELLSVRQAKVFCLVRASSADEGRRRVVDALRQHGIPIHDEWLERIEAVPGDLTAPDLGLSGAEWQRLAAAVDAIYHLGASVNVLADYATHRGTNVDALVSIVKLAAADHVKPVFFTSPMTVARRHVDGHLLVLSAERAHDDPAGLLTGYSQSKWAAEQVLLAAVAQGLPARIYRTSHALPCARTGRAKPSDTYGNILRVACQAGVIPEWTDSSLHGVPVDVFARLMVNNSLSSDCYHGIVHIENRNPLSVPSLLQALFDGRDGGESSAPRVSLDAWKGRCLEAAALLPDSEATLAQVLFTDRASGAAVENMFSHHAFETGYFESRGEVEALQDLTPAAYWSTVARAAGW